MPSTTYDLSGYGEIGIEVSNDVVTLTIDPSMLKLDLDANELQFWAEEWEDFQAAVEDLRLAVASGREPDEDDSIEVSPVEPEPILVGDDIEGIVEQYIAAAVPFVIDYTKEDGEEIRRVVSPYEVNEIQDGYPFVPPKYVRGFDHIREDIRSFRLSRIDGIAPAAEEFIGSISNPI